MLLKGKRLFIAEDNRSNLAIMQILLEREGAHTAFERWGRDMTDRLQKFAPLDAVLMDLMFPDGVSGFDLFDQIRQLPGFEKTPIIAVSAQDPDLALRLTRDKGFSGFIAKPINNRIFAQQILTILEGTPVWSAG